MYLGVKFFKSDNDYKTKEVKKSLNMDVRFNQFERKYKR